MKKLREKAGREREGSGSQTRHQPQPEHREQLAGDPGTGLKSRKPRAVSLPGKHIKRLKIKQRGRREGREGRGSRPGEDGRTYVAWTVPGRRDTSILYLAPVSSLMVRFCPKRCPSTLKYTAPSLGWILRETLIFTRPGMSPIAGGRGTRAPLAPSEEKRLAGSEGGKEEDGEGRGGAAGSQPGQPFPKAADERLDYLFSFPLIAAQHLGRLMCLFSLLFFPPPSLHHPAPHAGLGDICSRSDCGRFPGS